MDKQPLSVVFVGRPGSGKGTQSKLLAERLGCKRFSSGEHLKALIDAKGPLSELIRRDYDYGQLSPDWLAAYFFKEAIIDLPLAESFVCEGYPRNVRQAEVADEILAWLGREYTVLHLHVGEDEALKRQLERAKTEHRPDSNNMEKIQARFDVYRNRTEPLLDFFKSKGNLVEINGEQTPDAIAADIQRALGLPPLA
ncbi:MAG: nucleoside monophosphate kinase [Candidatus Paceibacterota bacterium]